MENDQEEKLQTAYKIYRQSLSSYSKVYRTYMRGLSRYSGKNLEKIKSDWLKEEAQHIKNTMVLRELYEQKYPKPKRDNYWTFREVCCAHCKKIFHSPTWNTKYCNYWCAHTMRKKNEIEKYFTQRKTQCPTCSKSFIGRRSDMKFCSNKCRQKAYYRRKN